MTGQAVTGTSAPMSLDEGRELQALRLELDEARRQQAVITIEKARLFEQVQARTRELTDARAQQTATADVLKTISRSAFDLQSVLDTLVESAAQLCEAQMVAVHVQRGEMLGTLPATGDSLPARARHGFTPEMWQALVQVPQVIGRGSLAGRTLLAANVVHIPDVASDPEYNFHAFVDITGARSMLGVPLLRDGRPIGVLSVYRTAVSPFTDRQIELIQTFADQAVIAIENARLFEGEQTRTREVEAKSAELAESLEYQTALSEVLQLISSSRTDEQPVFDAIARSARRLCDAAFSVVILTETGQQTIAAIDGFDASKIASFQQAYPRRFERDTTTGRAMLDGRIVHLPDSHLDPEYTHPLRDSHQLRSILTVPILRGDLPVGAVSVWRGEARPFTDKQIVLLQTFAAQAVIAIENARLFEEVQVRTRELARSVEELSALGEVGRTVSSSLDMPQVLRTVLEHACTMALASGGAVYVFDKVKAEFYLEAGHNMSEEHIARVRAHPIRLGDTVVGECGQRREAVQVADITSIPQSPLIGILQRTGVRSILAVPLLHQGDVIGALAVRRNEPGSFAPEIVRLLEAFAAQSAIAFNNARLFKEIEQKSREIEIASQHKSQFVANMSHELRTPLAAMLGYAELLREGIYGMLPERSTPILERIQSNGKHLLGLINTVLDISKIESGQFKLNLGEYALSSMVETVRVATESLAGAKHLALKTDVAKGLPRGLGDEQRLTQVLLNLVGNAIKFTDTGEVRIRASVADGRFAVAVSDTGPGIPPEERDKIFEKFHQIDNSSTRTKGGTGLGLAIAKDIVEMHGGRIWVESTLGHGATFRMELPVRAKPSEAGGS